MIDDLRFTNDDLRCTIYDVRFTMCDVMQYSFEPWNLKPGTWNLLNP